MPKLKTYGVITEEELNQAEREGTFLITDTVTCSYCDQPVRVDTNTQYLYCPQHHPLALSMYWYPGYPAVPYDAPRYKEMHFFLTQLERNRPLFDRQQPEYIAREKGCPFCDRYLTPVDATLEEQRDASLLNQRMSCSECGVSFLIEVIDVIGVLQIRFTHDARSLRKDTEQTPNNVELQTRHEGAENGVSDNDVEHSHDDATETETDEKKQNLPRSQTQNPPQNPPVNPLGNRPDSIDASGAFPTQNQPHAIETIADEHPNAHTDIAGQIVEYLSDAENYTARTGEMRTAIGCVPEGFNKARIKLLKEGRIREVKRGVYQLIHQP